VQLESGEKQKNLKLTWNPLEDHQNVSFFSNDYPLHYLHCYHFLGLWHLWLKITLPRVIVKLNGLSEAIGTKSLAPKDVTTTPIRVLGFMRKTCTLDAETSVSGKT